MRIEHQSGGSNSWRTPPDFLQGLGINFALDCAADAPNVAPRFLTDAWVQAFHEDYPGSTPEQAIHADRVGAAGVAAWQVSGDGDRHSDPAVAAHPLRDIPIVWMHAYTNPHGMRVGDVEYKTLNRGGSARVSLTKITDNSDVAFPSVEDYAPVVAVNGLGERALEQQEILTHHVRAQIGHMLETEPLQQGDGGAVVGRGDIGNLVKAAVVPVLDVEAHEGERHVRLAHFRKQRTPVMPEHAMFRP